jgi:starch synthase (maltosyl-transferring)
VRPPKPEEVIVSAVVEGPRIYNLFPLLAGTIDDWKGHLDRIAGMGFNWVFVNPFHVTGASGSLYAVKDYYRLNPAFRGKLKRSTDDLLKGFVAACDKRGIGVMMDLVINHTAKDALLTEEHPQWFAREPDGRLMSPFAVDPADIRKKTVWEDLAEIDYRDRPERQQIIDYFRDVIRYYLGLGFRGFRCDAAYKVSKDVWRPLIDQARAQCPDAVFVAENLGALQEQVESMRGAGFDFLFNSSKWWDFEAPWLLDQYEMFRSIAPSIAFPETHDTDRLINDLQRQGLSNPHDIERRYRTAYLFSAVFSAGVMIPIGYEYGFRHKLHVVETRPKDWETPLFDITAYIGEVNRMKAATPVLNEEGPQRAQLLGDGRVVCLTKRAMRGTGWTVTLVNADFGQPLTVRLDGLDADIGEGEEITPAGKRQTMRPGEELALDPGEVRIFTRR